ncbi:MAG: hypothetical protein WC527_05395 [Candidatus Margulisiibacteriota bacterium]
MIAHHKELASGRWFSFSFIEQMANIGSEVIRAAKWKNKNNEAYKNAAFERALELFDLTITDKKNLNRLRELTRLREVFVDFINYDNQYGSTDKNWLNYFSAFNFAARS